MAKKIAKEQVARGHILAGVKKLARAVKSTLGPGGRNVLLEKSFGPPLSTKDGVTVAKEIRLKDKFENMGAQLVAIAASKTNDKAGDGTTTAVTLTEAIYKEGLRFVEAGADPVQVKKGLDRALKEVIAHLEKMAIPVASREEIAQVGAISANNDRKIGDLIADAMEKVGKDGTITVEEAKGLETIVEVVEGMQFDKGYLSPYFVTNPDKMSAELKDAYVFITDIKISSIQQMVPILEMIATLKGKKPCLIIAEDIDSDALTTLVVNKLKGNLSVCAVKAPAFGDRRKAILEDIAVLTGATVISTETGYDLDKVKPEHLGSAASVTVTKEDTVITGGSGATQQVKARVESIRKEIHATTSDYDREKLQERLAKLSGGVAVIQVGAPTEAEMKEIKDRVEDALHATKAAGESGIVAGGGTALIRAESVLQNLKLFGDEGLGVQILLKALRAPAATIAFNSGVNGDVVAEKIASLSGNQGYNALTDSYEDLVKSGVIDPVEVTKQALCNAVSIASMLLTVEVMVTDEPEEKSSGADHHDHMHGMGGMGGMGGMPPGMGMM
jgi:chaperonin GroEL